MELDLQPDRSATGQGNLPRKTLILTRSDVAGLVTMAEVIAAVETAHSDVSAGTAAQPSPVAMSLKSSSSFFPGHGRSGRPPRSRWRQAARGHPGQFQPAVAGPAIGAGAGVAGDRRLRSDHARPNPHPCQDGRGECCRNPAPGAARQPGTWSDRRGRPCRRARACASAGPILRARPRLVAHARHRRALYRKDRPRLPEPRCSDCRLAARGRRSVRRRLHADPVARARRRGCLVQAGPARQRRRRTAPSGPPRDRLHRDGAGLASSSTAWVPRCTTRATCCWRSPMARSPSHRSWQSSETSSAGAAVGRTSADEITLYNSVGIAIQDVAIGSLLVERARAAGIGREIDLGA